MGGGQNNPQQAAQAAAASNASSQASANLSNQDAALQKQNYNYLFGTGGPGSGTGGSLTPFLNPSSLNVTQPTGAYAAQYKNATNTLNTGYNQQRGTLAQNWANTSSPSSTPSGFQADQQRQLGQAQANAQGQLFTGTTAQQYQDALNNFWNANNIASGAAASTGNQAIQGASNSGQTADNLYSTAGAWHQNPLAGQVLGAGIGAAGQLGSAGITAGCPASGAKIRTKDGDVRVEDLEKGAELLQPDGSFHPLSRKPVPAFSYCLTATFDIGGTSNVSTTHEWVLAAGGYVKATEAKDKRVKGFESDRVVAEVISAHVLTIWIMPPGGANCYLCDGVWSLI